ncbi:MAG TPA: redoxin family protein [Candidatus Polarisedimenticolaceae bacterium]|nr:redoxin family protein [Candidatus Polarisedimenticolaceae bacterium]
MVPRACLAVALATASVLAATAPRLEDLAGARVDPFVDEPGVNVFVFTQVDCPIANRYAPEIRRIAESFAARGVRFWLVYPDPDAPAAAIRRQLEEYRLPYPALRDPRHELVRRVGARVTPEVAVFDRRGKLAYRGRIDDRYAAIGQERKAATSNDLEMAIEAVLAGRRVPKPRTRAVGCFIADMK